MGGMGMASWSREERERAEGGCTEVHGVPGVQRESVEIRGWTKSTILASMGTFSHPAHQVLAKMAERN